MEELAYTSTWYVAHPRAAELAERIAELTPPGLDRVYFTTGGGEANESMWKMVRNWHQANGQPQRTQGHRAQYRLPRHQPGRAVLHRHRRSVANPSNRCLSTSRT